MTRMNNIGVDVEALYQEGYYADLVGNFAKARRIYQQVLAHDPQHAFSRLALAQLDMMESGFHKGRSAYEVRFAAHKLQNKQDDWRTLPIKRWQGESLTDKRLYLWSEQGIGDVIMFCGFLPYMLAQNPAHITLGIAEKLIPLFSRSFPEITVESMGHISDHFVAPALKGRAIEAELSALPPAQQSLLREAHARAQRYMAYDLAAPIGDMMVYGLPGHVPARHGSAYLKADPALITEMETHLPPRGSQKRIGISWFTSNPREGQIRSIPLEQWQALLKREDCYVLAMQHHVSAQDIQAAVGSVGGKIASLPFDPVADIDRLAALTCAMDHIITIDNSLAHLAGALGVPTTLLLPTGYDFRWPPQPEGGTLWYQSVKTLRQQTPLEWQEVMARVDALVAER